eukprot:Seg2804.2 transcript_id=Seg2804.2/GoldUCD/mRNA.D3Y31 product="Cannabinoid receptor type 1A" protein_id=Seg2804.2/GoldUCD/D3Y31
MHTPSNMLVGAMSISDLLVGLVLQPLFATYLVMKQNGGPADSLEVAFLCGGTLLVGASFLLVSTISVDRYVAICHPYKYTKYATCKRYVATAGILMLGPICVTFRNIIEKSYRSSALFVISVSLIVAFLICYARIHAVVRRQRKRILCLGTIDVPQRAEAKKQAREKKTTNTIAIIVCLLLACMLPTTILQGVAVYQTSTTKNCRMDNSLYMSILWARLLFLANSFINPVVYGVRIREIRTAAFRVLGMARVLNQRTQEGSV